MKRGGRHLDATKQACALALVRAEHDRSPRRAAISAAQYQGRGQGVVAAAQRHGGARAGQGRAASSLPWRGGGSSLRREGSGASSLQPKQEARQQQRRRYWGGCEGRAVSSLQPKQETQQPQQQKAASRAEAGKSWST